ncbi:hypothetical protein [Streptomyces hesseae]|uniref:Uncharacterized protein n=1 Tax=Streptomyces hesseae TaxID=3075519 RepID=A0ABU2T0L4_9ACTN|nr:hypothetical protein [Streptomyces sp. DSM 40473]MDT0453734.1 hypothetical protein [Streptomyces sp. DSM 40473]
MLLDEIQLSPRCRLPDPRPGDACLPAPHSKLPKSERKREKKARGRARG